MSTELRHHIEDAIEASYVDLKDGGRLVDTPAATDLILNDIAYDLGAAQVEADTLRHQRDQLGGALEGLVAALDGGHQREIDHAIHRSVIALNTHRKERT